MEFEEAQARVTFPAPGEEVYLPPGGVDPDFFIPAEWQRGERRWKRLVQRLRRRLRLRQRPRPRPRPR